MTTRTNFDESLNKLHVLMIEMGALCEQAIADVSDALMTGDREKAQNVIDHGDELDQMERSIERLCMNLLLLQQPVARDLRQISSALKMITDIERIGDQAEDIAEFVLQVDFHNIFLEEELRKMAGDTQKMVNESIDAYVKKDLSLAKKVIEYDDVIDLQFEKIKDAIIRRIAAGNGGHLERLDSERAIDLLMVAKYYERIGDHATNIAEWVEFSITGVREK